LKALRKWRRRRAARDGIPESVLLSTETLLVVADLRPTTVEELAAVEGVSKQQAELFGSAIVRVVSVTLAGSSTCVV